MSWGKVDDKLHAHLKAQRAGEAMALWVMALSWTSAYLTNGFVPKDQPSRLLGKSGSKMAATLVRVGLWELAEDGFRFHDYLDHNPSAEEVHQKRTATSHARKLAGKRGAEARWQNGKPDGNGHGNADSKPTASRMANGKQTDGKPNGKTMAPSRTHPKEEGEGARTPARTPARAHARTHEDPSPVPQPDEELTEQETKTLEALAEGASIVPGRWDAGGAAWKRKALARELIARGVTLDDAFNLGDYLAQPEAAKTHKTKTFDANWFVFGTHAEPDREFKRLDWVCRESKALGASPASDRPEPAPSKPKPKVVSEAQRKANAQAAVDMVARMKAQKPEAPPGSVANEGLIDSIVDGVEHVADRLTEGADALGSILDSIVGGRR